MSQLVDITYFPERNERRRSASPAPPATEPPGPDPTNDRPPYRGWLVMLSVNYRDISHFSTGHDRILVGNNFEDSGDENRSNETLFHENNRPAETLVHFFYR